MPYYNGHHKGHHHVEPSLEEILAKHPEFRDIAALNPNPEVYQPTEGDLECMKWGGSLDLETPNSARQRRRQVEYARHEIGNLERICKEKEEGEKLPEWLEQKYPKFKVKLEMLKAVLKEVQATQEREGDDLDADSDTDSSDWEDAEDNGADGHSADEQKGHQHH
ncbi:MAG: hypothetical protein Q9167_006168 [Letrouitia subvulpina]